MNVRTVKTDRTRLIPLRMLGENVALRRDQWDELLESLRPDSELAKRLVSRLTTDRAEEIREATGCPWELACKYAECERDSRPGARIVVETRSAA